METVVMLIIGVIVVLVAPILKAKTKIQTNFEDKTTEDTFETKDFFAEIFNHSNQQEEDVFQIQHLDKEFQKNNLQQQKTTPKSVVYDKINMKKNNDNEVVSKKSAQERSTKKKIDLKKAMIYKTILERPY